MTVGSPVDIGLSREAVARRRSPSKRALLSVPAVTFPARPVSADMARELAELDVTRDEAADRLEAIADERRNAGSFDAHVNNCTVHLSPPDRIGVELGVCETSSLLRGGREGSRSNWTGNPSRAARRTDRSRPSAIEPTRYR